MQSGGPNRERLYRAGFNPPQADQTGGRRADRVRAELNGMGVGPRCLSNSNDQNSFIL